MADGKAREIVKHWERLDSDRGQTLSHWQQVSNYINPDRADYTTQKSPGQKRMQYVFDGYPIWAREQFSAGCHSFLTSSEVQWFSLRTDDDRVNSIQRVRAWFDAAAIAMFAVFNSGRYTFGTSSHELYDDIGAIGNGCMAVLEGRNGMPLFTTRHMREICVEENEEDRIDTVVRRWQWTAGQAEAAWSAKPGWSACEKVIKALADGKTNEKFWFLHRVMPRKKRDPQRADKRHMPFESVYVCEGDEAVIDESGFLAFPYLVPRFSKATGERLGRGPGTTSLPDVKMLNEMAKLIIKSAQLVVHPMMELPDDGYILPIRATPGSLIFRRPGLRPDDRITAIETKGNLPVGREMQNDLRSAIGRVFYVDLLHMPTDQQDPSSEGKGSTATYWQQRQQKELMSLSPFTSRMQGEYSGDLIDRTFSILWRKSAKMNFGPGAPFPPPPPEISGQQFHVEYVSPMALAQRSGEMDAIDRVIARMTQLRQMDPESPMLLDYEFIMRRTSMDLNAPAGTIKAPEVLQAEAEQKQQAEAALNEANLAQAGAKTLKDGGAGAASLAQASAAPPPGGGQQMQAAA